MNMSKNIIVRKVKVSVFLSLKREIRRKCSQDLEAFPDKEDNVLISQVDT